MRPHLFKCVLAEVPFLDAVVSTADTSVPWTSYEIDEWGSASIPKYFEYIKQYCPITNIQPDYSCHFILTAGLDDGRVGYWEVR
jgi:oligopeptidase B